MESKYEKQILEDIRSHEILSESEKHPGKKKNFESLEGIFHGKIKHKDEDIQAVQIKLKEI